MQIRTGHAFYDYYVEGVIYQAPTNNKSRKEKKNLNKKEEKKVGRDILDMPQIELTKEAESKLTTLVECLNLDNESTVINELFYKFVLDQEPDKRRTIMAVYQMNVKNTAG
jgi:hypothetical protein